MRIRLILAALAAGLLGSAAQASDKDPCAKGMVCASAPQTLVDALQKLGYKAQLGKDDSGDPMVDSAASGYNYTIYFYECENNKDCASVQFIASFDPDKTNTPELANMWNSAKRFSQMSVNKDGVLNFRFDLSTMGGLPAKNFDDQVDWWTTMLGELAKFFKEHPDAK